MKKKKEKLELPKDLIEFTRKYPKIVDYSKLLLIYNINIEFVINNPLLLKSKKNSEMFFREYKLSEKKLEELINKNKFINWEHLCTYQHLSIPFMEKYIKFLDRRICFDQILTLDFIEKNINASFIDWVGIARYQLHESELEYFDNYLNWNFVFYRENLSLYFKQKHIHKSTIHTLDIDGNIITK